MGCDIHMHVEFKQSGKWYCGDYFYMIPQAPRTGDDPGYRLVELYDIRNYSLFATLANVRNYGNTTYIDEPRGLPADVSDFVNESYEDWMFDAHSCSYFTLQELIDFHNQKHPLKRSGMISPEAQRQLDQGILPDHWCQYTNEAGWERREWEEENDVLVPIIERLKKRAGELNLIYDFYWDSKKPESRDLAYKKSADIRIVFWFDN